MSSAVEYTVKDNVAILQMNNPPVNALSRGLRLGLMDGLRKAQKDQSVKFIIITGKGRAFCAGADITEFANLNVHVHNEPTIQEIGKVIECSEKAVIAAIHGFALGGGLEIALFCHFRVATKTAKVGFPEVTLGILPGAEGTQRLPRVAPLQVAMEIIASGRPVSASEAVKYGIIDKLVDGDVVQEASKFGKYSLARFNLADRRLSQCSVKQAENVDKIYQTALAEVKKRSKGVLAPVYCLKAVRASAELPYTEGVEKEHEMFRYLLTSGQAKALQYAFFCERSISKLPSGGSFKTAKPQPIKSVAVIGAGTMGSGIAIALMGAGLPTYVLEQNDQLLQRGVKTIQSIIQGSVQLKKRTAEDATKTLALLRPTLEYEDLRNVDLVIEAVFERMDVKQETFRKLDAVCKPDAVLCSNTSSLDIDRIASATKRPDKVIGTHFFVPAYYMRLLENVYGSQTSATTAATTMELGKRISKIPVLVGNCHGFVGNRMYHCYSIEAQYLVEEGAFPYQVDQVVEDFGIPLGPFKVGDLSGLDIGWNIRQEQFKDAGISGGTPSARLKYLHGNRYCSLSDKLYEKGRYGRKVGMGWYRYEKPGGKTAYNDVEIEDLLKEHCLENGISRRPFGSQEIFERCIYSLINEGFKILEDKIASKPEEIDVIWLYGYGWPRHQGGPMFYARQVGLKRVYERVCHYNTQHPDILHWQPSILLERLARQEDVPMADWPSQVSSKL